MGDYGDSPNVHPFVKPLRQCRIAEIVSQLREHVNRTLAAIAPHKIWRVGAVANNKAWSMPSSAYNFLLDKTYCLESRQVQNSLNRSSTGPAIFVVLMMLQPPAKQRRMATRKTLLFGTIFRQRLTGAISYVCLLITHTSCRYRVHKYFLCETAKDL